MKDQLAKESAGRVPVPETQGELLWGFHPTTAAINANRRRVFGAFVQVRCEQYECLVHVNTGLFYYSLSTFLDGDIAAFFIGLWSHTKNILHKH